VSRATRLGLFIAVIVSGVTVSDLLSLVFAYGTDASPAFLRVRQRRFSSATRARFTRVKRPARLDKRVVRVSITLAAYKAARLE
jgi:hypothetical protein